LQQENRRHDEAEETRLLYVAMTRARDRLILLAGPAPRRAPWLDALAPWGYSPDAPPGDGDTLWRGIVAHRLRVPAPGPHGSGAGPSPGAADAVRAYEEAVEAARSGASPPFARPSGRAPEWEPLPARESEDSRIPAEAGSRDLARGGGIVLHRVLETWDGTSGDALLERMRALSEEVARDENVDASELARECETILGAFLGSSLAERFRRVEIVGRELSVLWRAPDGRAYRGSIDLLYRDRDGSLVVADYKTDRETDLPVLQRDYGDQLGVYAGAVAEAVGLEQPPRAELWMLRSGERVEIA
jgi:ATP-dependent helicase/nuclease subunit A